MRKRSRTTESDDYPEFFKVYIPELCSEQLMIPSAFVHHLEGDLPQISKIETPAGSWNVNVKKIDNDLFFLEGWKQFAQENSLQWGDFLTFSCVSKLRFHVKIYGKNSCRKEIPFIARTDNDDEVETQTIQEEDQTSKPVFGTTENIDTTPVKLQKMDQPLIKDGELTFVFCQSFEVEMRATYLKRCLFLPIPFSKSCIVACKRCDASTGGIATLRNGNKLWSVKVNKCATDGRFNFSRHSWIKFVKDNSLHLGDICRFNIIDFDKFVIEVSISR